MSMNSKTQSQLKNELITKQSVLRSLLLSQNKQDLSMEEAKDVADRSDIVGAWAERERMEILWVQELKHIHTALHRIQQGTFGVCADCGEDIPVKRLRVRPDASLCLICQESNERDSSSALVRNQQLKKSDYHLN